TSLSLCPSHGIRLSIAANWASATSTRSRESPSTACAKSRSGRRLEVRLTLALSLAAALLAGAAAVWAGEVAASSAAERVVQVTARRFTYNPEVIELELGVPAVIELTSLDRAHGFAVP